jgi:hypothetical protein
MLALMINKALLKEYLEQVLAENSDQIPGQFIEGQRVIYQSMICIDIPFFSPALKCFKVRTRRV